MSWNSVTVMEFGDCVIEVKTDFVGRLSAQTTVATYVDIHAAIRNPQPYKDAVEHFKRLDAGDINLE